MLQQTQVDRVLPKYLEWLDRYPSFEALADAREGDVVRTWYPLGYNIRPRRLHAIAREAVENYGGQLPGDEATLRSFKGIGAYTAGAVMSFAFGKRAAILDTNVARVLSRVFVGAERDKRHASEKHLWALSRTVLPHRHVFDFNQALMDFGATVCQRAVAALRAVPDAIEVSNLPIHRRDTASEAVGPVSGSTSAVVVIAAVIERDGYLLVSRRLMGTHLAGLWEFPGGKCEPGETHDACLARELTEELGVDSTIGDEVLVTEHAYPERRVRLHFRHATIAGEPQAAAGPGAEVDCTTRPRPARVP